MKKSLLLLLGVLMLVVVTGCGKKNQVTCSASMSEGGVDMKAEVVADFDKDDKLTDATITYDVSDSKTAETYCALFKLMEDADKGITVSCSGSKITITGYANIDSSEDEETIIGVTKEEFKKKMQENDEQKFTCK